MPTCRKPRTVGVGARCLCLRPDHPRHRRRDVTATIHKCTRTSNKNSRPCAGREFTRRVATSTLLLERQRCLMPSRNGLWFLGTFQRSKLGVKGTTLSCLPHISSTGVPCSPTARTCMAYADSEMSN